MIYFLIIVLSLAILCLCIAVEYHRKRLAHHWREIKDQRKEIDTFVRRSMIEHYTEINKLHAKVIDLNKSHTEIKNLKADTEFLKQAWNTLLEEFNDIKEGK